MAKATEKKGKPEKARVEEKPKPAAQAAEEKKAPEVSISSESIPSRSSRAIEANKIISEDIKAEIYEISEVVLDEKVREFSKRISELELFRANTLENLSEMKEDIADIRSSLSKQRIGSAEQLSKINDQLNSLSGNVSAMEKAVVSSLDGLSRSVGGEKKR